MPMSRGIRLVTSTLLEESSSASEHMLRMTGYYNRLNQVGVNLPDKIVIGRVL